MSSQRDRPFYKLGQMFGCVMGEDDTSEFAGPVGAAAAWIKEIELSGCLAFAAEIRELYATTASAVERKALMVSGISFLAHDASDFDSVMAEVERMLRERIARES